MSEEIVTAIASALSTHGQELVVAGGTSALKSLYGVIRARFGGGTPEAESLDAALREPDDSGRVEEFARSLASMMARDPDFAQQVLASWRGVTASGSADGTGVVNNFSGQADQVVQARTIRGGITF
jgi:hypothetical protein